MPTRNLNLEGWEFKQEAGRWIWRYVEPKIGGNVTQSAEGFPTLLDCISDAKLNGYRVGPDTNNRR